MNSQPNKPDYLYKVSPPRDSMVFEPSTFWRTQDYTRSDDQEFEGAIEDQLLYAGEHDYIAIHILPKVFRLRVEITPARATRLQSLGIEINDGIKHLIISEKDNQPQVFKFEPTVYEFDSKDFELTPSNEYVSRSDVTAKNMSTYSMGDALEKWSIQLHWVDDIWKIKTSLEEAGIDHDGQD
jgi:hypothetical protein